MKLISYSLFAGDAAPEEMASHIRGFYFNCRMNNLIYPEWRTILNVDLAIKDKYRILFDWLMSNNNLQISLWDPGTENTPLCKGMLRRLNPAFLPDVSHVLCRDADSITTYREALCVQEWLESGKKCHAMNDNRAHSGLMGGMVGFDSAFLKACMEVTTWEQLVGGFDLSQRGSDQHWMNQKVLPRIQDELLLHGGYMAKVPTKQIPDIYSESPLPGVDKRLWENNLTCRHIGSAGVVDMEVLRFFKRFDSYNWKYAAIEAQFPKLFYWHNV